MIRIGQLGPQSAAVMAGEYVLAASQQTVRERLGLETTPSEVDAPRQIILSYANAAAKNSRTTGFSPSANKP